MNRKEILHMDEEELERFLLNYLKSKGVEGVVLKHIIKVVESSKKIIKRLNLNEQQRKRIIAGAYLHDIGRSITHGMDHAVEGAKILKADGFDEKIIRIVERHIGAGLTAKEAEKFGLPKKDYIPETVEEKIVALADNLVDNDRIMNKKEYIESLRMKFSNQPEVMKRHISLLREFEDALD